MKYPLEESSLVEFKREIPQNEQIIKTIIGFCNQQGGRLFLGIEDNGTIIGVDEQSVQAVMEYLEKAVFEASHPAILSKAYTQRIGNKVILIIEVAEGMSKPYCLKKEGPEKGVYIRLGRSTVRANEDIISELRWSARGIPYDAMPVRQAKEDDLDYEKIQRFLAERKSGGDIGSLQEAMVAYNLVVKEFDRLYPTVCGILMFGKNPQAFYPEARIMCTHFGDIEISKNVLVSKDMVGTLDDQFRQAHHFVVKNLNLSWEIVGVKRIEKLEIPEQAVREMIMNAVIHRNYHVPGPDKIAIFDNRVEIFSQGGFPGPVGQNLTAGFTYLRNTSICKIFREMGLIETFGIGLVSTFASYAKAGLENPRIFEGENFVKCILPRKSQRKIVRKIQERELAFDSEQIINLFSMSSQITISDVIDILHFTRPTASRKLAELVKKGLIRKVGKGRGIYYVKIKEINE